MQISGRKRKWQQQIMMMFVVKLLVESGTTRHLLYPLSPLEAISQFSFLRLSNFCTEDWSTPISSFLSCHDHGLCERNHKRENQRELS